MGVDANTGVAMESKARVGSEMETVGAAEKSKVMAVLEVEMVGGTEVRVDTDV